MRGDVQIVDGPAPRGSASPAVQHRRVRAAPARRPRRRWRGNAHCSQRDAAQARDGSAPRPGTGRDRRRAGGPHVCMRRVDAIRQRNRAPPVRHHGFRGSSPSTPEYGLTQERGVEGDQRLCRAVPSTISMAETRAAGKGEEAWMHGEREGWNAERVGEAVPPRALPGPAWLFQMRGRGGGTIPGRRMQTGPFRA